MMNIKVLGFVLALGVMCASCADKGDGMSDSERSQQVFDLWMAKNHPGLEKRPDGMYIEWLKHGDGTATPVSGADWVQLDYTGRDLRGNIISTRNADTARREQTFTQVTHYVPHFAKFDPLLAYFTAGEYAALKEMKVGDSVRLYLPSALAYSTASASFANGYEGWWYSSLNPKNSSGSVLRGRPVIIDLALRDIVSDPAGAELAQVQARAAALDMTLLNDTIPGLYFKVLDEYDPNERIIPADTTVYVSYECRFLDGHLARTNIEKVALKEWGRFGSAFAGTTQMSASTSLIGSAMGKMIKHERLRYNSKARLLFISDFGHGTTGFAASATSSQINPVIYPYTPLEIVVTTMPEKYGQDEE